jgi:hypothetical protein
MKPAWKNLRHALNSLVENPEGKKPLGTLRLRPILMWM